MKVVPKKHPAELVAPKLDEARERRMWRQVDERLRGPRPRRAYWLVPALAAALAVVLYLVLPRHAAPVAQAPAPRPSGAVTTSDTDQILAFAGGSSLALRPHTAVVILAASDASVRVRLDRGGLDCAVRADEAFTVEAGTSTTSLEPGHYVVEQSEAQGLRVATESGKATVHAANGTVLATITPGETWASTTRTAGWVSETPQPAGSTVGASTLPVPSTVHSAKPETEDASHIFARAERARLAGKGEEAARAFDELYHLYPGDARASIAALEAGRLHLHGHGTLKEAVSALTFARANAREPFREDAHAGLVEALARIGQLGACHAAREDFLERYPASPHGEKVTAQCP